MQVLDSDGSIQCDSCERTYHPQCTKMDKREFEKLVDDDSQEFNCHLCNKSTFESDLSAIKEKVNQLDDINKAIQYMSSQYDEILRGVKVNKKKIDKLEKENKNMKEEITKLKSSVKFLNDARVQNDCIINGITSTEPAVNVVLNIATQMKCSLSEEKIEDAYFVGVNKGANQNKSIVVKFRDQKNKKMFMDKKAKLKESNEMKNIYINDYLSKESLEIFNYAKSLKATGFKFVFYKGNKLYAKKNENSRPLLIKNREDVDKLLLNCATGGSERARGRIILPDDDSSNDDEASENNFMSPNI